MGKITTSSYHFHTDKDAFRETKGKVYATGDWHGVSEPAMKVFDFLQPEDTLIFLGDAADRGRDGVKLLNKLLTDPRVVFIKGNHEQMMSDALWNLVGESRSSNSISHWFSNGGAATWDGLEHCSDDSRMWYVKQISFMPDEVIYTSDKGHTVICEHAGYSPFDIPHRSHDPQWDRHHFYDRWNSGYQKDNLDPNKTYLVHGHTPVQYLRFDYGYEGQPPKTKEEMAAAKMWNSYGESDWIPTIIRYCDEHKFDIDMCTIVSDRIALLDLDTFDEYYISSEGLENIIKNEK